MKSCIHASKLWHQIHKLQLSINMRVASDEIDFSVYVLTIGDGTAEQHLEIGEDMIKVPPEYVVHPLDGLIAKVFPDIFDGYTDKYFVSQYTILTPNNDYVDKINEMIIKRFPRCGENIPIC